jgi:hypothetical protein
MEMRVNQGIAVNQATIPFAPLAFVVFGVFYAAPLRPRFAPIVADIGLSRDAPIHSRKNSPKLRDLVKYPG